MDVTDILRDRIQEPAGLQRMVSVSLLLHGVLIAGLLLAPRGFLSTAAEAPRAIMTITLSGGGDGPSNGGLTSIGGRPVQVQTPEDTKRDPVRPPAVKAPEMITEGRSLAKIHPNVVVKCPLIPEGIKATKVLSSEGIRVNVTLCFTPVQALLAAKAGAYIISPFVGRLDDIALDGMELVRDIVTVYRNYGYPTQVLAASMRGPLHILEAARAGAHIATMPFKVLESLFLHPLTDKGLAQFLADYQKVFQEAPVG